MFKKKQSNKNKVDFFGIKKSPIFLNSKNNINFLNSNNKLRNINLKKRYKVNKGYKKLKPLKNKYQHSNLILLNKGKVMPKQKYINWNYKQIKRKFPGLNPYGDADMDGSPNRNDCKPFDATRDGKVGDFLKKLKEKFVSGKKELAKVGAGTRSLTRKLLFKRVPIIEKKTGRILGYRKEIRGKKPVSEKLARGIVQIAGLSRVVRMPGKSKKGQRVYAGRGRPRGSYKYFIPGKGKVSVFEYKKWLTQQRALARIKAAENIKAIQAQQVEPLQDGVIQESQEGEYYPEEGMEEYEEPTQQIRQVPKVRQVYQQYQQYQQSPQQYQQPIQQQVQQRGQTVGGPVADHILNAPNIARGELRHGTQIPTVRLSERPQANPQGEMYTQIDPMSGRTIIHRRISEKFATGEAL